jgi:Asp-tRNA(Asn)/Glu-tRNA(Gln) amidotransferase A subunit family amidase
VERPTQWHCGKADVIGETGKCTLSATEEADRLDEALRTTGRPVGPWHGIPVVIKDNVGVGIILAKASLSSLAGGSFCRTTMSLL